MEPLQPSIGRQMSVSESCVRRADQDVREWKKDLAKLLRFLLLFGLFACKILSISTNSYSTIMMTPLLLPVNTIQFGRGYRGRG